MPYAVCLFLLPYAYLLTLSLSSSLTSYAYSFRTRNFTGSTLTHLLLIYDFIRSSASTTAHYAPLTLLVSYLLSRFIFIPHLIIQSDGYDLPLPSIGLCCIYDCI